MTSVLGSLHPTGDAADFFVQDRLHLIVVVVFLLLRSAPQKCCRPVPKSGQAFTRLYPA